MDACGEQEVLIIDKATTKAPLKRSFPFIDTAHTFGICGRTCQALTLLWKLPSHISDLCEICGRTQKEAFLLLKPFAVEESAIADFSSKHITCHHQSHHKNPS
ncbi:hypothetical protein AMTR_s00408p00014240 [Amborella trichopoda]|uniref:Uncharacterized protein n=1 Tax=Amborella trichopoda TaxID=13333 RepID=W1PL67_AMBTC|nr:hypothetical protein AMTR_s00408p00014240 [Amborella trichopoda]